jgi:thioredoxin reductase
MQINDVLIIGAGPAGIAAGIQLKRYGLDPILFERAEIGGLLKNANLVEDYPGFPGGIPGPALVQLFKRQLMDFSLQIRPEEVTKVDLEKGHYFLVKTGKNGYYSRNVVVASGTQPRRFREFEIPAALEGQVFYEVYPLLGVSGREIVIVGAGDAAFDYGLNLSRKNRITILNRGQGIKCLPLLWDRAQDEPQIEYFEKTAITNIKPHPNTGVILECTTPDGPVTFQADFLVGAIGREPALDFLSEQVSALASTLEQQGLLYFIGDVKNDIYRQTSISVGDGVRAAMQIYRKLKEI